MLSKGTYARKAPMLLKDYLKAFSLRIIIKELPSSLGNVPKGTYAPRAPMLLKDFLKVFSSRIVLKDVPSDLFSSRASFNQEIFLRHLCP